MCARINWQQPGALRERTRTVQRILLREGYQIGKPDGELGPATRDGIARYQAEEGLRVTGRIDRELMGELTDEWGVGDSRARNDSNCVQARVYDGGSFEREPPPAPDGVPAPGQSNRATQDQTSGRRLRCPANRIQEGRTCVCRAGLVEDDTGACITERGPVPAPKPEFEQAPLPPQQAACSGGQERNAAGRCACPRGLKNIDGLCQLPQETSPAPKPKQKVLKKRPKEPRKERRKAQPKKAAPEPAQSTAEPEGNACRNNMILNENGKCQCYLNLKNSDGKCLVKVRAKCLPGEVINVRGSCECPKNREIRDGKCILRQ